MAGVRAFRPEDITAIVRLRRKIFHLTEQPSDAGLAAYYHRIFFENPWRDDAFPSFVYEDARGVQAGFLGVIPRRMRLGDQAVRAAVSTELMVDPAERGIAGFMLLRAFFGGPQDVSISDRANPTAREILERLGGETTLWFSLYWVRVLCPFEYAAGRLGWRGFPTLTQPLCRLLDGAATRILPGRYRERRPATIARTLDRRAMVEYMSRLGGKDSLVPVYDEASFRWLLERLAERHALGPLEEVEVLDEAGAVIGWFIYAFGPDSRAEVVQMAALDDRHPDVFTQLCYHAWQRGAITVRGRLDPQFVKCFTGDRLGFTLAEPWTLVHSRRPELLAAFHRGDVFLSRLDGEWWLGF
ncbi:MAG: hypothetical protein DMD55_14920 [Gemmatimonadetes bacterium]|nr:MAG: hypothetical protein DMD55_14920 [Gemmatimonadota bacterium]